MIRKNKKVVILCTAFILVLFGMQYLWGKENKKETVIEQDATIQNYILNLSEEEYTGIYSGRTKNNLPDGGGIFTCDDFILTGKWKNGKLNGKSQIEYKDGAVQEATFKNGNLNKKLVTYREEGYVIDQYKNGKAYGNSVAYNASGEIVALDRYYDGIKVSEWIEQAENIPYGELYNNQYSYLELPILVKGTIYHVKQEGKECCLKIKDEEGHTYIASYINVHVSKYKQAVIPNLKKGDKVELCGFFNGIETYDGSDEKEHGFSYPHIALIYGVRQEEEKLMQDKVEYGYEKVAAYPYLYAGLDCQLELIVSKIKINYNNNKIFIEAKDQEDNLYYIHYKIQNDDRIPVTGEKITVTGRYNGNEKRTKNKKTYLYPCINGSKIEIN